MRYDDRNYDRVQINPKDYIEGIFEDRGNSQVPFIQAKDLFPIEPDLFKEDLRLLNVYGMIQKVIYNGDCTIVLWRDRTKTVVRCDGRDRFDPEKGLAMAIVKRICGNTGNYYEIFKEYAEEETYG